MIYSIICIFTHTGSTYTFKNCSIVNDNESVLEFTYTAMSDGHTKTAKFPKRNICGWSVTPQPYPSAGADRADTDRRM